MLQSTGKVHDIHVPSKKGDLRIHYLCNPNGHIDLVPCNIDGGEGLLGIARMFERMEEKGQESFLFVTGDLFPKGQRGRDPYLARLETAIEGYLPELYRSMNVTAVIPGLGDLLLGLDDLKRRLKECGLEPVCANLVRGEDKATVFEPYIIKDLGGIKIGILGLMPSRVMHMESTKDKKKGKPGKSDMFPLSELLKEKDCKVIDPVRTASVLCPKLREKGADLIIALSYLSKKRERDVLVNTSVDVTIGGNSCEKNGFNYRAGGIRANTEHSTQWLGAMDFHFSGGGGTRIGNRHKLEKFQRELNSVRGDYDELVSRYGTEDADKLERLARGTKDAAQFKKLLSSMSELELKIDSLIPACSKNYFNNDFLPILGYFGEEEGRSGELLSRYLETLKAATAGHEEAIISTISEKVDKQKYVMHPDTCRDCHAEQYAFWKSTPHARAFKSVLEKKCGSHPNCIKCHSTGYRCENGYFLPPPPESFQSINCEVCHGFLGNHADDFLSPTKATADLAVNSMAGLCIFCHDKKHSPEFDAETYLPRATCPPINYDAPDLQKLYRERDEEMERIITEEGGLKNADQYVRTAILKKRLGAEKGVLIDLLFEGFEMNHSNIDLLHFLVPLLIKENRPKEALDVLETYIVDNQRDAKVNMEIIRMLTTHPSPEVNDPEAAREYIAWFLENLKPMDADIFILLAMADIQLIQEGQSLLDEAWSAVHKAEQMNPSHAQSEEIRQIKQTLNRLKGK